MIDLGMLTILYALKELADQDDMEGIKRVLEKVIHAVEKNSEK